MRKTTWAMIAALALTISACGDEGPSATPADAADAAADTAPDGQGDASSDSEDPDTVPDTAPDPDTATDTATDTASDTAPDPDTATDPDTAADTATDPDTATDTAMDTTPDTATDTALDPDTAPDTGPPEPPTAFGTITGACGALAAELDNPDPSFHLNLFHFDGDPFDPADLDPDAFVLFDGPNAGGSSKCSETFSMEVLDACEAADLYKTETEITYTAQGSITDYAVWMAGERVGVSVSRAYKGPILVYTVEDATTLLTKKLEGVNESSANVSDDDVWVKQILHIWTLNAEWAVLVEQAWDELDPALKADTIVLMSVELGSDFVTTDSCDDAF